MVDILGLTPMFGPICTDENYGFRSVVDAQVEVVPDDSAPRDDLFADIDDDGGADEGGEGDLVDGLGVGEEVGRGIDVGAGVCAERDGLDAVAVFWDRCMGRTGIWWVARVQGHVGWIQWMAKVDALDGHSCD